MRSPHWTRDELVLALDLYFRIDPIRDRERHPEVIGLSTLLRSIADPEQVADPRYRSAQSVHAKLQNFMRLDPDRQIAGLPSGGKADEIVWATFAMDRPRLQAVARAIRSALPEHSAAVSAPIDEDDEAPEGRVLARLHRTRERNRKLIEKKKAAVLRATGRLACEVCAFDFGERFGELGQGFIECHHVIPLASAVARVTALKDLALVCSNCHRMLHRGNPWPTLFELKERVARQTAVGALKRTAVAHGPSLAS